MLHTASGVGRCEHEKMIGFHFDDISNRSFAAHSFGGGGVVRWGGVDVPGTGQGHAALVSGERLALRAPRYQDAGPFTTQDLQFFSLVINVRYSRKEPATCTPAAAGKKWRSVHYASKRTWLSGHFNKAATVARENITISMNKSGLE
jgi:hypothetical protein